MASPPSQEPGTKAFTSPLPMSPLNELPEFSYSFQWMGGVTLARLSDSSIRFLDLEPLGYEYKYAVGERHDLNWLTVRLTVEDADASWSATASTLLTWELNELVQWLRTAAWGSADLPRRWCGLEPSIAFEGDRTAGDMQVRVHVNYRFLPPESFDGPRAWRDDLILALAPNSDQLLRFADELEQEMQRFPVREEPPGWIGPP